MSRSQRLLDLLQILRRHRYPVAGHALAAELGISLRTLYRDIATLQQQGANIEGGAGLGYLLRPGFELPPLMFSLGEIEALVLGMRWVARRGDRQLMGAARDVLAKVGAVLPPALREELETSTLLIGPAPASEIPDALLQQVREVIRLEHRVQLDYRDAEGQASQRVVWPFALGYFEQTRVLAAWCELRQGMRHFRLDRVAELLDLGRRYPRRRQVLLREWRALHGIAEQ
ncbi:MULTISPECIES: helix-turn-helix transcriptional regulator [unclassified Pseudomonas]|uniref:helix-turn-helix transcriptional regulator n=1 Tax=unclassified Pseudomonas TaxID=196821 RepID=UPI000DAAD2D0|nr:MULTISPECIES: YafY family protein [unclassified Pseudomonas]MDW3714981.1 YafY family protein [Pseudomonas sp. 2023EL-01195]PZE13159.1 transcriptional regulator [Pseudomonas sp. 57B-090624]